VSFGYLLLFQEGLERSERRYCKQVEKERGIEREKENTERERRRKEKDEKEEEKKG
jgi:hypothetical protein